MDERCCGGNTSTMVAAGTQSRNACTELALHNLLNDRKKDKKEKKMG